MPEKYFESAQLLQLLADQDLNMFVSKQRIVFNISGQKNNMPLKSCTAVGSCCNHPQESYIIQAPSYGRVRTPLISKSL